MGSRCQKSSIDNSDHVNTDDFTQDDFKIEQEQQTLKVHKGGRKVLHKSKKRSLEIESDYILQESVIESFDLLNHQLKSCQQKSTHSSSEKKFVAKETQNQLISIMKQESSQKLIKQSLKGFQKINHKLQQKNTKVRGKSEKHVRFKLPKSQNQQHRAHSQQRARSNSNVQINQ